MTMKDLAARADPSWMRELLPDPESEQHKPNRKSRQVRSGHYVPVRPTALPKPSLVIFSPPMAKELGLSEEACRSEEFLRFFSGDIDVVPGFESWATPYALSIMGDPHVNNCPFQNGNGYGDGRAMSIGEVIGPSGQRWEMQLKGGGPTPFRRTGDGRAVLRSSIREFLASEAMHHMGISTTRAISLIVSGSETTERPWYSSPEMDARFAQAPPELKQMMMQMMVNPDVMIAEKCAITCRVAPSFMRVGHLDLFARRASKPGATEQQRKEHEMIVQHAINREYPHVLPDAPLPQRALEFFQAAVERIGEMVAGWLRVGFCQGNFNCDNCLVAGRQMDYGPFGFIDKYDPLFAKWTGSGSHYAFMNQPGAALANIGTLASSLEPLLDAPGKKALQEKLRGAKESVNAKLKAMFCRKLGFQATCEEGGVLFGAVENLMQESEVDYTLLFRQLPGVLQQPQDAADAALLEPLAPAFYRAPSGALKEKWAAWCRKWRAAVTSKDAAVADVVERMNGQNPKYILREYMLVQAYTEANEGDYSRVHELYKLIQSPYAEQPEMESKYYRRAPDEALTARGTSVMT